MTEPKAADLSSAATAASAPADPKYDFSRGASELRGEVYRPPEYLKYLESATHALKTVRIIVYAGMTGFVILAAYGFLLIYRLTSDVHDMVGEARIMSQQMQAMTRSMANMHQDTSAISGDMTAMTAQMAQMQAEMARMSQAVTLMQHSATNIDRSVSPMLGTVTRFMPFGASGYPGAPPYSR